MEPTPQRAPWWVLLAVVLGVAAVLVAIYAPPLSFLTRQDLTSCGDVTRDVDGQVPREAVACLQEAQAAGAGAELTVTDYTVEGDPITTYYRAVPDRSGLEVYVDSRDGYGKQGWTHLHCPQARTVPDVGTCQDV
ncbi:hypothetical protein [Kineococcus sp. SYSU DK004]|uniref:hypothetical protein n=1 Tax=Kineococcus sp. SYSU DK004 TaxID=3383125 RepID=UPI003D7E6044